MFMDRPNFLDSEYFYYNEGGKKVRERMKLLPNAPKSIRKEYEEYVSAYEEWYEQWNEGLRTKIEDYETKNE
ncbi:hypothetical protein [Metabacillus bambusae]|uniref:Uncharacterized protein n=1 Tax=Metabacillus bambusae TaxID=2795218 RepID=A0ABS3N5Y6_9BACI|nr:hypothetical protein [Metabacillus bambusae]MBO1513705.1 hypothetical protein [Metabacillus bambusae]